MNRYGTASAAPVTVAVTSSARWRRARTAARTPAATSSGSAKNHRAATGYRQGTSQGRHSNRPPRARTWSSTETYQPIRPWISPARSSRAARPPYDTYASTIHSAHPTARPAASAIGNRVRDLVTTAATTSGRTSHTASVGRISATNATATAMPAGAQRASGSRTAVRKQPTAASAP